MEESKEYLLKQARFFSGRCGELPFNPTRWWVNSSTGPDLMVLVEYNNRIEAIEIISVKNRGFKDNI